MPYSCLLERAKCNCVRALSVSKHQWFVLAVHLPIRWSAVSGAAYPEWPLLVLTMLSAAKAEPADLLQLCQRKGIWADIGNIIGFSRSDSRHAALRNEIAADLMKNPCLTVCSSRWTNYTPMHFVKRKATYKFITFNRPPPSDPI